MVLKVVDFTYTPPPPKPIELHITQEVLRGTLMRVQEALLRHDINGGSRNLRMQTVCDRTSCGTAACIGGWVSIFLLGFEAKTYSERSAVQKLFNRIHELDNKKRHLSKLFYSFESTENFNDPRVAATAIQRYLDGENPWPKGKMPNVLRSKRPRKPKA